MVDMKVGSAVGAGVSLLFAIIVMAAPWLSLTVGPISTSSGIFGSVQGAEVPGSIKFVRFLVVVVFLLALAACGVVGKAFVTKDETIGSFNAYKLSFFFHAAIAGVALLAMIIYGAEMSGTCDGADETGISCSTVAGGNGILIFMIFLEPALAFVALKASQEGGAAAPQGRKNDVEMQASA